MPTTAQNSNGKSEKVSAQDLADQVDALRSDLSDLSEIIAGLARSKTEEALKSAKASANDIGDKAAKAADNAQEQMSELYGVANEFVNKQPATALGIAAGIGFLVGFMGARK